MSIQRESSGRASLSLLSKIQMRLKPVIHYGTSWPAMILQRVRYWRDYSGMRGSRDMFTILGAAKRFVKTEIPRILELDPGTPVHMELPIFGANSFVVIITARNRKAVLRTYPLVHRQKAEDHVYATTLASSHGANVPRILYANLNALKPEVLIVLEEFIEGEIRYDDDLSPQDIQAMARQLAHLHTVHSSSWGRVNAERPQPFALNLKKRVQRDLKILKRSGIVTDTEIAEITAWVAGWLPEFAECREFSLTHNDILPANGLFTPEGEYYMVDLNRLQWDMAAREVVRCYYRQLKGNTAAIEQFNQAYFASLSPQEAQFTKHFCQFYEVFYRISTLVKTVPKLNKDSKSHAKYSERQKRVLGELLELVKNPTN